MSWLLIAILGQIMLGTAAVVDKLFLRKRISDPIVYTFWLGVLGVFAVFLLPFGFQSLSYSFIVIGICSGVVFLLSLLTLYIALSRTSASTILPFIAALTPFLTLPFSSLLITAQVNGMDMIGMLLLIMGAIIFFLAKRSALPKTIMLLAFASAALYGFSSVLQKIVFEHSNFFTGFFWAKMGEVLCALSLLMVPQLRKRIFAANLHVNGTHRIRYLLNRVWASSGSLLLNGAIFLSHPALVQSSMSFRYVVIFIASWFLLQERSRGKELWLKIVATVFVISGIGWLGIIEYARNIPYDANRTITWGVTFSGKYSRALGLDWQDNFKAIIEDLHPKKIRLISYWDHVEFFQGKYDFSETDWLLTQLRGKPIEVIFVLGIKVPRWPECHLPNWARELSPEMREKALHAYMSAVIMRYRDNPNISVWQIENEPFLRFGKECPSRVNGFLEKEIALVREIDQTRLILITDGGEFGRWIKAIKAGDIIGSTMYRRIHTPSISPYIGIIDYPLSPSFFRLKQKLARWFTGEHAKQFIVVELQAEAWGHVEIPLLSYDEQTTLFSPAYFEDTIQFARETGFDEY
ncbi:MAG: hypothetical protein AAB968_02140, partial [Patescibacteria group bacterium]